MPQLLALRPDLPDELTALVHKAAARKASDRYDSALAMRLALEAAMQALPVGEADQEIFVARAEEHSPTLVWRRPHEVEESNEYRRYGRPLPPSVARTLKPARHRRDSLLPTATPVGFRARRHPIAARAVRAWRVQSVSF
jgi:hypothetical protein